MVVKFSLFLVTFIVSGALSASIDCNTESCAKPSIVLEELGCKAVMSPKSCCAKRFDCPDFKRLDENTCSFAGKEYKIGEILPRSLESNTKCVETCFCTRQDNEPAKFSCSKSDCGVSSFKLPGCLNIYGDLNECCSTSVVCDEVEKESLATCYAGGKEYREGEKFIPESHKCYECLCHKDFDNTTIADNAHCRKLNCKIDLKYKSFVQRGCLPVFHNEKCCPVDWECPKLVKKIIKRSIDDDDDETKTVKQEFVIVTPSKNHEEYLADVKRSNANEFSSSTGGFPSNSNEVPVKEIATEPTSPPTLSTNPFVLPIDDVTIPIHAKIEDETTTQSLKSLTEAKIASTASSETTNNSPYLPTLPAETSTTALGTENLFVIVQATTELSSVFTTSASETISSTTATKALTKDDSEESKESESMDSEEDDNTNLFGEHVDEDEKKTDIHETKIATEQASSTVETAQFSSTTETTQASSTTETTQSSSTTETTYSSPTTETLREVVKVLDQPGESTTVPFESTNLTLNSETSTTSQVQKTEPATETTGVDNVSNAVREVSTEAPTTTQEPTSQAPTTVRTIFDIVLPTEFEKLLTTLREFVAKADSLTSTEAPSTISAQAPKMEQQVEYVNYTVSSEKHEEAAKSISKRSVDDADFIPRYFKHQSLSNKDKVCDYNGRSFKVGEIIQTDNICLECMCEYAPVGHCIFSDKCNL